MRVTVIAPGFPPDGGGVEAVVAAVARGLADIGVDVEVWATHRRGTVRPKSMVIDGVVVRSFASWGSSRFNISPALFVYATQHLNESDIVHAHSYHGTPALAALLAPGWQPVVFTPHYHGRGHTKWARAISPAHRIFAARLFRRSAAVIAVSEAEQLLFVSAFPSAASAAVLIRNAVDVQDIHSANGKTDAPPTVITLGRLEAYKRVDIVIDAFGMATMPGQLLVIGDGTERRRLADRIKQNPRARDIRLMGYLPRTELTSWLRTSNGLVSMSQNEAFGIGVYEAIAAGAAVTLSNLPAHREVQGLLGHDLVEVIEPNVKRLSESIDRLLGRANSGPRSLRDWTAVAEEHKGLYHSLLPTTSDGDL